MHQHETTSHRQQNPPSTERQEEKSNMRLFGSLSSVRQEMLDLATLCSLKRVSFRVRGREELLFMIHQISLEDTQSFLYSLYSENSTPVPTVSSLVKPCSPIIQEFYSLTYIPTPSLSDPPISFRAGDNSSDCVQEHPVHAEDGRSGAAQTISRNSQVSPTASALPNASSSPFFDLVFLFSAYEKHKRPALWFRDLSLSAQTDPTTPKAAPYAGTHGVLLCNALLSSYFSQHGISDLQMSSNVVEFLSREIAVKPIAQWDAIRTPVTATVEAIMQRVTFCQRDFNPLEPLFDLRSGVEDEFDDQKEDKQDVKNVKGEDSVASLGYYGVIYKLWRRYDGCQPGEIPLWLMKVLESIGD